MNKNEVNYRPEVIDFLEKALENHQCPDSAKFGTSDPLDKPLTARELIQNVRDKTPFGLLYYHSAEKLYDNLKKSDNL